MQRSATGPTPVEFHRDITGRFRRAARIRASESRSALIRAYQETLGSGPRSGRVYRWRGRTYTASAPGEPPAKRSGALLEDVIVGFDVKETSRGWTYRLTMRPTVNYAQFLEHGTRKMAPRPILAPVLEAAMPELRQISRLRIGP